MNYGKNICRVCSFQVFKFDSAKIMNKHIIDYYQCPNCGFIQTEKPYWLEEAYKQSINDTDTGMLRRNITMSNFTALLIIMYLNKNAKFLDYAGGYGLFVRMMRDKGFDFYWHDLYTQNIFSIGFEYNQNVKYEMVTSFESFEHFINPLEEFDKMTQLSDNILISTTLIPNKKLKVSEWDYYGIEHGQHISFYSLESLKFIAEKNNMNLYTNHKNIHLFTKRKFLINITPLYLISRTGLPNILWIFKKHSTINDANIIKQKKDANNLR